MLRSSLTLLRVVKPCASQRVALLFVSGPSGLVSLVGKHFICLKLLRKKTILYIGNYLRKISILCSHALSAMRPLLNGYIMHN